MSDQRAGIHERLAGCFRSALASLDQAPPEEAREGALDAWDSMMTLEIVALVEKEFQISIGLNEVGVLDSFEAFEKCVIRHLRTP